LGDIVTIELFGETYKLKADDGVTNAQDIVSYLEKEINRVASEISPNNKGISKIAILLVATMNISNEYFELKQRHANLLNIISTRSKQIEYSLNEVLSSA
jgi:cell division protein ZapA (FtsZ GTPase activity inhibitor)